MRADAEWLESLKAGDVVALLNTDWGRESRKGAVEILRVTPTQIIATTNKYAGYQYRFNKSDGYERGGGGSRYSRYFIKPALPEEIAAYTKSDAANKAWADRQSTLSSLRDLFSQSPKITLDMAGDGYVVTIKDLDYAAVLNLSCLLKTS